MHNIARIVYPFALSASLLLSACGAADGQFPSLERRPYETNAPVAEQPTPQVTAPTTLSAVLQNSVDALIARHNAANGKFVSGLPAMRTTAANAAGSAAGSEKWVNAHLILSRLDKSRADSVAALGALDTLIAEQSDGDSQYVTLLVAIQQDIAADVAKQRDEIDRMSRQIGE
jgi:hypothetical protein